MSPEVPERPEQGMILRTSDVRCSDRTRKSGTNREYAGESE